MSRSRDSIAVASALFVVSLGLRLWYRSAGLFLYDSVVIAQAVEQSFGTGTLQGQINGRHGSVLVNLLVYVPYRLATGEVSAEQSVLLTNILCGSLAVVALYALTLRLLGDRLVAGIGAFAFSVSPVFLSVTTYGKPHGLELLLLCSALFFVLRGRQENSLRDLAIGASLQGMAILCREAALLFVPLVALLYLDPRPQRERPWVRLAPGSLAPVRLAVTLLPGLAFTGIAWWLFLGDVVHRTLFVPASDTMAFSPFEIHPSLWLAFGDLVIDLVGVGIPLAAAGLWLCLRRPDRRAAAAFLGIWSAYILVLGNTPGYWPRMLAVVTPPMLVLCAVALAASIRRLRVVGVIATLLFCGALFLQIRPIVALRSEVSGEKAQALWIAAQVPEDAVIVAMDDAVFVDYYTALETRTHPVDDFDPRPHQAFADELLALAQAGRSIYALDSAFTYDRARLFRTALGQRFEAVQVATEHFEDYHRSALRLRMQPSVLYELRPRTRPQ